MNPDPRWLEILKASGWQLFWIGVGLAAVRVMFHLEILPPSDSAWVVYGLPIAAVAIFCLALAAASEHMQKWISSVISERRLEAKKASLIEDEKQEFRDYIPFMTDKDKEILGYLLETNQKTFTSTMNGDYAASLIGRRFIRMGIKQQQIVDQWRVPWTVPDHLWEVLEENRDQFPKNKLARDEAPPWVIPFMSR